MVVSERESLAAQAFAPLLRMAERLANELHDARPALFTAATTREPAAAALLNEFDRKAREWRLMVC